MPAARVKRPKIEDLNLTPVQLAQAKDFVEDLGIGVKDDLYYYAILWCKNNQKSNGDYLTSSQRKKFDEDVKKNRRSALLLEILADIALLEGKEKEDKERLQDNKPSTDQTLKAAKTKLRRTQPISKPPQPKLIITIDKVEVEKGESYTVSWKSENATIVSRSTGFQPRIPDIELSGSRTIVADRIGSKTFSITVRNSSGRGVLKTAKIQIVDVKTQQGQPQSQPTGTPRGPSVSTSTTRISRVRQSQAPSQVLVDINKSLGNILKILEAQSLFFQKIGKIRLREAENERRSKRESLLEAAKGIKNKAMEKVMAPVKSILEKIWRFILFTFLGRAFTEFIKWAGDPKNAGKVNSIVRFLKDFWWVIGGAALYFMNPLAKFMGNIVAKLGWFSIKFAAQKLLFTGPGLAIAAAATLGYMQLKAEESTRQQQKRIIEKDVREKAAQTGQPEKKIQEDINKRIQLIESLKQPPNAAFASGGIVTPKTGITVKGAGVDTQLVPVQGGGGVVLQKGEIVLQKGARERMMIATGIDPLMFNIGANANRPRTIGNKLTAMSTGGVIGDKNANSDLLKPQAKYILQRLISGGLTPTAAAGIVANIGVESAYTYDPNILQRKGGPGRGLVQWEKGGRFDTDPINLSSFAKSKGKPWNDMNTQIDYILHEMNTHPEFRLVKEKINKAKNINDATSIFLKDYEKAGTPHIEKRIAVAQEIIKSGWLNPPKPKSLKPKTGIQAPDLLGMFGGRPRPASATERPRPRKASATRKPRPKPNAPQRAWWDPRRFMGMKSGGVVGSNLPIVGTDPEDKHLALLKAGEYVIPRLTVQKIGVNFFDNLVAKTDENSNAAKLAPISRDENIMPPMMMGGGMGGVISLPPIMKNMMEDTTTSATTSVPSFGVISPMASGARKMLSELYGIG